ncbi:MAG: alpha-N-acetylglucosaminidase C-terminal domain-containing protein, partial [Bacteroidales bacterium]|nr:alpha-N-acetylglucosaminidase C-terminal domain-containing protein [Bacteroidales bacterium]
IAAAAVLLSCGTPSERAAKALAGRIVPEYGIKFKEKADTAESYRFYSQGGKLVIEGSSANAMAVGLGRYLRDYCKADISWYLSDPVEVPGEMPVVAQPVTGRALVPYRFFLNYCTFGYEFPWWDWAQWERLIDWMALSGINLPLAITGEEAVWQEVLRLHGLSDDQIRAWFTGPAHLPWNRMCNIDGEDGPLPQGWIDSQVKLQKQILRRERELGMKPVLPAFNGHVPEALKEIYPQATITDVSRWGGFPKENLCHFLSPTDSLFGVMQKEFLEAQDRIFGTDHIYGMDLFNEVEAPSWDPETLASIGKSAYESLEAADPQALWLQMGWLFHHDRKHWTPENVKAYLEAVPQGKVILLDYYTEHTPVWTFTDGFYGQPYIFCYLGNFGGNTRLAGPFRKESARITEALSAGGTSGIGCTLEAFGINKWLYEYVMDRAWGPSVSDEEWLSGLDERRGSPAGFWRDMADSIYLRGSFSEGMLFCGRPSDEGHASWRVNHTTAYDPLVLERLYDRLLSNPSSLSAWKADAVTLGIQVRGNRFAALRDEFVAACRGGDLSSASSIGASMKALILEIDSLAYTLPQFRTEKWLQEADSWGGFRDNAWHIITRWGNTENLGDYASRAWSGLSRAYYLPRWELFIDTHLDCLRSGKTFDPAAFDRDCRELELRLFRHAPELKRLELMTYNIGAFSKNPVIPSERSESSVSQIASVLANTNMAALQELDSCNRRSPVFQLEKLSKALDGRPFHFARAFPFAGGAYGNGVLSSSDILASYTVALPMADGAEPRSMAVVETASCVFSSVHLDHVGKNARLEQVRFISDWFSEHYSGTPKPVFLCGDFNSRPESEVIGLMKENWDQLSGTEFTYSTDNPHGCIDYVFSWHGGAPVRVISSAVVTDAGRLSDHFPVSVTVEY